jgi:protein-tyrosine phosphatase
MQHSGVIVLANNIDQIAENLFVGGNPTQDEAEKFKFIVAMNHTPNYRRPNETFLFVAPIKDEPGRPPIEFLRKVAKCAEAYVDQGPTLIHCTAGLNRSAMIAGMVLINKGMCADEAINLIREKRGQDALENEYFVAWLYSYGEERGTNKF